jgi:hypothetical protein
MQDLAASGAIGLAGPTASGKTAAALAIAQRHAVEIISVDSALVYRGMDIGTAKPSAPELAAVPHHLIDIRDPSQAYSAAEFVLDARRLIGEIRARGRLPLLVGGTMLYFKALMQGLDDMPPANPAVRAALEAEASARGWPAMHAELARVDPITAARLAPNDSQRIQRALEVHRISGRPLSSFHSPKSIAADDHSTPGMPLISLEPADRAWWTRSGGCARAATCTPICRPCAAWATARPGSCSMHRPATHPLRWNGCANSASTPRASWPSAKSPGCAPCRRAKSCPATTRMRWRRCCGKSMR